MKIKDAPGTILIIIALVTLCLMGYQVYTSTLRDTAELAVLKASVDQLGKEIKVNRETLGKLEAGEQENKAAAKALHDDVLAAIKNIKIDIPQQAQQMPMPQAVEETKRILGDPGVTQVADGVLFTPSAFRLNLAALLQSEKWGFVLAQSMGESNAFSLALKNCDAKSVTYEAIIKAKDDQLGLKDKQINVLKKSNFTRGIKAGAVGVAIGIILTLLLHK